MGIIIDKAFDRVHLTTKNTSYVIETFEGELLHTYWGKRIKLPNFSPIVAIENMCSFYPNPNEANRTYSLDGLPREFPDFGRSDYRNPAVRIKLGDGTSISHFRKVSFEKINGKPEIKGLPSTYAEKGDDIETLIIKLIDDKSNVEVKLYYSVFYNYDIITRHVVFKNYASEAIVIDHALSGNVDFYNDHNFEVIHFSGSWARERGLKRLPVGNATHVIDSKRGASGHVDNPLVLLARPDTTDLQGEVYGMNLVYSGNFKSVVEVNSHGTTRFQMGLNDFDFEWTLEAEAVFYTPEVVLTYSNEGFNGLSYNYHRIYSNRLCRGSFRDQERPILINNWEATYFEFTQEKLENIIDAAKGLEIELFVLDDGWFGLRDSDKSGLGDWFVNKDKLPSGLTGISEHALKQGMEFGLWFEPEMVSPDSDLYRQHPDWCLHVPGHSRSQGRNQLILDMSREDVQNYIIKCLSDILEAYSITYVKWDMNRNMTEVGSALLGADKQREVGHRYILGLYSVLETITSQFDHVLFESCSGGGGRFDPGMLYYMPQTWTSDDTDAHERLSIQYGTSFAYPQITMGAHVSVSPNHQVGREICLERRALTAMMANLGFELDLSTLSKETNAIILKYIKYYKSIRKDIQFGRLYRLKFDGQHMAILIESKDQKRYYLFYYRGLNTPNIARVTLPLQYLTEGQYRAEQIAFGSDEEKYQYATNMMATYSNDENIKKDASIIYDAAYLNNKGLTFNTQSYDFDGQLIVFSKI